MISEEKKIRIFTPLTYGDKVYAERVITKGKMLFGDKYEALTEHLLYDDYIDFLGKIDIAIFNHKRQQAMGNTISLLGLGKKVYMRSDVTQWAFFKIYGIKVYDIDQLEITTIPEKHLMANKAKVKNLFSEQRLICQLTEIFK